MIPNLIRRFLCNSKSACYFLSGERELKPNNAYATLTKLLPSTYLFFFFSLIAQICCLTSVYCKFIRFHLLCLQSDCEPRTPISCRFWHFVFSSQALINYYHLFAASLPIFSGSIFIYGRSGPPPFSLCHSQWCLIPDYTNLWVR